MLDQDNSTHDAKEVIDPAFTVYNLYKYNVPSTISNCCAKHKVGL